MRKLISSLLVLGGAMVGCVPGNGPIRITGTFPVDTGNGGLECKLDSEIGQTGGRLDASGGGDYIIVLAIDSEVDVDRQIVTTNGTNLTSVGTKNWIIEGVALKYKLVDLDNPNSVITMPEETIPMFGAVKPNSTNNRLGLDIIGDLGAAKLRELVTDPAQRFLLTVNFTLKGHLESGQSVPSNTVSFPLEVTTSGKMCMTEGNVTRTGPCGTRGGQDNFAFDCCTGPGTPPGCP